MLAGPIASPVPCRLVAAAYRDEQEAGDKVGRLGGGIDVCLFASPVPYDIARRAGALSMPATVVPLGGMAIHAALATAALDDRINILRLSIDQMPRNEIEEAYDDIGLNTSGVYSREESGTVGAMTTFHERLFRNGQTTGALTSAPAVAERLTAAGVPAVRINPTTAAIRSALNSAALIGAHHRLEESQLCVAIVDVPTLREPVRRSSSRYWRDELRLAVQRLLVQETNGMNAMVWPIDDHSYVVTGTRGSISAATDGFRIPPFAARAREELGLTIEVGIGMGRTGHDAEIHARAALARTVAAKQQVGIAVGRDGQPLVPSPRVPMQPPAPVAKPKGVEILARLAAKLEERPGSGQTMDTVVDAESAGRMLGVTSRTARRLLRTLVDDGLAWPLPPNRSPQPGRPRQLYRLIVEKLQ